MKTCLLILQLLIGNFVYAQYYSFAYKNNETIKFADLAIGNDCFRISDPFHDLLKVQGDNSLYALYTKTDTAFAAKISIKDYLGSILFRQDESKVFYRIDTIFSKADTNINGFLCKRVEVNYIQPTLNDKEQLVAADTIQSVFYIAPLIDTQTPFSFVSPQLTGLVMKWTQSHPIYDVTSCKIKMSYQVKTISTTAESSLGINQDHFQFPRRLKFLANYGEFLDRLDIITHH